MCHSTPFSSYHLMVKPHDSPLPRWYIGPLWSCCTESIILYAEWEYFLLFWNMAQAQLNPSFFNQTSQKHILVSISPDLTLKIRKKAGELVILFYYRNKKSFSLPACLFSQVLESQETILVALQLIQGNLFQDNYGSNNSSWLIC